MKKTNRIRLLIASTAVLGASILIPTLLTACSTASDNNNNNNGQQQVIDQALMDKITEVNKAGNEQIRKEIYRQYITALHLKKATNKSLELPAKPQKNYFGSVTQKFDSIVQQGEFVDQFINMLQTGLTVDNATEENNNGELSPTKITPEKFNQLIEFLKKNKNKIAATQNIDGSFSDYSTDAFAFIDGTASTKSSWKFTVLGSSGIGSIDSFELFLTDDINLEYEIKDNKVQAIVKNLASATQKNNIRLRVQHVENSITSGFKKQTINLYFKPAEIINLPTMLFEDFDKFIKEYNNYQNEFAKYLQDGLNKYGSIIATSNTAATMWNQFMLENYENIQKNISNDLINNKGKSKLISWLEKNTNSKSGVVNSLKTDLDNLPNITNQGQGITVTLKPVFIQGNNGNDNVESINQLSINFPNKKYAIDLYPTDFKFTQKVDENIGFTSRPDLTTYPSLTFAAKSKISCATTETNNTNVTTDLITPNQSSDISDLFSLDNIFSDFLSNSLASGSQGITNILLDKQMNKNTNYLSILNEYTKTIKGLNLLKSKPDILTNLIFDNIDLDSMAYNVSNSTNNISGLFTKNNEQAWRNNIRQWLSKTTDETKVKVEVMEQTTSGSWMQKANIRIWSLPGSELQLSGFSGDSNVSNKKISQVLIFFGSQENTNDVIVNTATSTSGTQSSLFINPNYVAAKNTVATNINDMVTKLGDNAWVIFEEKLNAGENGQFYAFYMGADKNDTETMSPIVIPSELINTPEFAKAFTGK